MKRNSQNINAQKAEDELLRQMIGSTGKKASANLKYRIMQQVAMEDALKAKTKKSHKTNTTIADIKTVFISMYVVIATLGISAYFIEGKDYLLTTQFMWTVILISLIFSFVWLAFSADAYLKEKRNKKAKSKSLIQ